MSRTGWKLAERAAAALFGLKRWPANSGYRLDFGGAPEHLYDGQVKNVRSMSLARVEELALEMQESSRDVVRIGVVVVKRSARKKTPYLVVMTAEVWERLRSMTNLRVVEEHRSTNPVRVVGATAAMRTLLDGQDPDRV